ncbi:hypothetical protein F7725_027402 [Dissostichus mawsoni]|uniref:Uncharacterized protein n=1 Tax=Dissostichus mawsoni TaxID=36200 RepID=A0A7J5XCW4_DISMA|nr:hypothetical protein F7725_027402 [Dissostichus mawsoni]
MFRENQPETGSHDPEDRNVRRSVLGFKPTASSSPTLAADDNRGVLVRPVVCLTVELLLLLLLLLLLHGADRPLMRGGRAEPSGESEERLTLCLCLRAAELLITRCLCQTKIR